MGMIWYVLLALFFMAMVLILATPDEKPSKPVNPHDVMMQLEKRPTPPLEKR